MRDKSFRNYPIEVFINHNYQHNHIFGNPTPKEKYVNSQTDK